MSTYIIGFINFVFFIIFSGLFIWFFVLIFRLVRLLYREKMSRKQQVGLQGKKYKHLRVVK